MIFSKAVEAKAVLWPSHRGLLERVKLIFERVGQVLIDLLGRWFTVLGDVGPGQQVIKVANILYISDRLITSGVAMLCMAIPAVFSQ